MRSLITAAAVFAAAGVTSADSIDLNNFSAGAGMAIFVSQGGTATGAFAGQYKFDASGGVGEGVTLNGPLMTFCLEVLERVEPGSQTFDLEALSAAPVMGVDPDATAKAQAISRMYTFAGGQQFGTDNDYAAAFQIAIWEVIADFGGTLDVGDGEGEFFVTSSLGSGVTDILDDLLVAANDTSVSQFSRLGSLTNPDSQDQVYVVVPLPGAAGLATAGLAGVVLSRRRRRA